MGLTTEQLRIFFVFVIGTCLFAAAQQGVIGQNTALLAILGLTLVVRFGLLNFSP